MNSNEKAYYDKWIAQVKENKKLKEELEKYKKIYEKNGDFQKQYLKYKYYYEPLENAYNELYYFLIDLNNSIKELISLYENKLLLNSAFSKVKILEEEKTELINQTKIYLSKIKNLKLPKLFHKHKNTLDKKNKELIPIKKEFELKHFVIKKKDL